MSLNSLVAVVPAAGLGKRFIPGQSKAFYLIDGLPIVVRSFMALQWCDEITEIVPALKPDDAQLCMEWAARYGITKIKRWAHGGAERQDSVRSALELLASDAPGRVLVHDAARPMVTSDVIARAVEGLEGAEGAIAAVPVKDTIKLSGPEQMVAQTLERASLWAVQTPQVFYYKTLLEAHRAALSKGLIATDDAALIEAMGGRVRLVMGSYENIKVTTAEDAVLALEILKARASKDAYSCG